MNRKQRAILLVTFLACAAALLIAITRDDSLTKLQQRNVIRIGYAVEEPYAYIGSDGQVTGESPEVARVIVTNLGIANIEWVQTDFDRLIPQLLNHRFDVIAAGMFITPERAERVRFSNPTFRVYPGLLVRAGNPLQLNSYQDLVDNPNLRVAAISGAVEADFLQELGLASQRLVRVPDALVGKIAVVSGVVDALALSSVTVRWMEATDPLGIIEAATIFELQSVENSDYGGFAFRPDDRQLAEAWNMVMADFIGSTDHLNLISRFGFTAEELPFSASTVLEP